MRGHLALVLLGSLISRTASGGDLEPVRVGRYSAIVPGPSPEQADPLAVPVHVEFPLSVQTVGRTIEQVVAPTGYRLAHLHASCPSLSALLGLPLPAVHRTLGPMCLDEALKTLAGPAHTLVIDPMHRLVSFELRQGVAALAFGVSAEQAGATRAEQTPIERSTSSLTATEQASRWGLAVEDWTRYQSLMIGPRGTWSLNLDPVTALGVHADTDAERRRYAEILVRLERERTMRELAFEKVVQQVKRELYPNEPLLDPEKLKTLLEARTREPPYRRRRRGARRRHGPALASLRREAGKPLGRARSLQQPCG